MRWNFQVVKKIQIEAWVTSPVACANPLRPLPITVGICIRMYSQLPVLSPVQITAYLNRGGLVAPVDMGSRNTPQSQAKKAFWNAPWGDKCRVSTQWNCSLETSVSLPNHKQSKCMVLNHCCWSSVVLLISLLPVQSDNLHRITPVVWRQGDTATRRHETKTQKDPWAPWPTHATSVLMTSKRWDQ